MQLPRAPYRAGTYESQGEGQNTMPSHGFVVREIGRNREEVRGRYEALVLSR